MERSYSSTESLPRTPLAVSKTTVLPTIRSLEFLEIGAPFSTNLSFRDVVAKLL